MHKLLFNGAYIIGKFNLASVIAACCYLLIYLLSICIISEPNDSALFTFYAYHMLCSGLILLALMDASLAAYLLLKLGETITNPNRHNQLSPPNTNKLCQWLVWTSLGMFLLVGISAAGIWHEQAWAQILGSYSLFFAICSLAGYLTIKCSDQWLRHHHIFMICMHVLAFVIQVALHVLLLLVTLFCVAATL